MAEVTVLLVTQGQPDLLRLTAETFRRHNAGTPFILHVWENSPDNAESVGWARDNADRLYLKDGPLGHHHAHALDRMCRDVKTPYTMTLDDDVLSTGPVLGRMLAELRRTGAFAAGPSSGDMGSVDHFGRHLVGQPRINPCCALFRTPELARLAAKVSFVPYECCNAGKYFDTGAMIRHAAEGAGMTVTDLPWVWESVRHYGSMTLGANALPGAPPRAAYEERKRQADADWASASRDMTAGSEVVVARYRERLDWVSSVGGRVVVYDKSGEPGPNDTGLPNVGREAHTYAEHVARRYDDLPEVTVFCQGNPFDHAPDFLRQAKLPTSRVRPIGRDRLTTGPGGDPSHAGLPTAEVYQSLTGLEFPGTVDFAPGAQFAAHRSAIRRYPRSWWRALADRLADPSTQGHLPWVMERLWLAVLAAPPRPHFYHEIPGWFSSHAIYERAVAAAPDRAHFVEVGAWAGRSTAFLATEILNSGKDIRLDVVDHFRGSPAEPAIAAAAAAAEGGTMRVTFERNLARASAPIRVVERDSAEAARLYQDRSLDFVFLDGSHDYESVRRDIAAWLPKVRPGGVLAGDDATYSWPGVVRAVDEAFGLAADKTDYPCWVYRLPPG